MIGLVSRLLSILPIRQCNRLPQPKRGERADDIGANLRSTVLVPDTSADPRADPRAGASAGTKIYRINITYVLAIVIHILLGAFESSYEFFTFNLETVCSSHRFCWLVPLKPLTVHTSGR